MKNILIIVVIIIVIGAIGFAMTRSSEESNININNDQPGVVDKNKDKDNGSIIDEIDTSTDSGEYRDYESGLLTRADEGDVVLFFHASWCPTCKALERNIDQEKNNIPEDLTILTLDYDIEKELKQKYNIVIQHTFVQVDSGGNEIAKWTGGNDLSSITKRIK